ncbi:MAG: bifunctional demethylmenaquinone methyltransferase/2-methoxy-6-polyprenyl-1,4-benzoquinol methylase UbiE [Myxococcota bacterium]
MDGTNAKRNLSISTKAGTGLVDGSGAMFDGIAGRYDRLNRVLSLGLDRTWRSAAVESLQLGPGYRVLDLATGTADLPLEMVRREPRLEVVGLDPSLGMLGVGERKIRRAEAHHQIRLVPGCAERLPFPDESFDGVSMAFGIRNVRDRTRALREIRRVVRPGGRVALLELNEPRGGLIALLARLHLRILVPAIGALLSSSAEYRYLRRSVEDFPRPERFAITMTEAGLRVAEPRSLGFGACSLFSAQKSEAAS